ncbi:MAG TPA: sodium/solute symporter [Candidatus Brocadiia bacterium]|nr:sodium/solute symporter [Candidatus Brocadiia bacterium]
MTLADWTICAAYLAGAMTLGVVVSRRLKTGGDYFLAGRSMGWLPVGLSVMVTLFSAVNYTAFPNEVAGHGCYVLLVLPAFLFVWPPVARVFIPFFHDMRLLSAYEYLERRFDVRARRLASALFIGWRLLWMATALYATCRALSFLTGMPYWALLLLAGVVTVAYTTTGGMKAVMWTDVAQFAVLFGGIVAAVAVAVARAQGGLGGLLSASAQAGLFRPFHPFDASMFSLNPSMRISLWSAWIGASVAFLARYGADQVTVQRYFAARSLAHARRGFGLNILAALATMSLLAVMGLAVHAHGASAGAAAKGWPAMKLFASFVSSLPWGMAGLIVAGLMAATMSSLDSGMNSCAAAFASDLAPIFGAKPALEDDASAARRGRWTTLVFGALAIGLAFGVAALRQTVFELANVVVNAFGSPLLGLFLAAMFSRRVNAAGALAGGAIGAAWSLASVLLAPKMSLHYYAVLNLAVTMVVCWGASLGWGGRPSAGQLAWTWKGRRGGR